MNIKKLTTMAMLTAISMIVFLIEAQIPIPIAIPGVKLGVANVITLFALWTLGWREAGAILVVRIFLGNLIVGNMMGMLYSMAGGVLCWVVMCLVKPLIDRRHIWVMSMLGARRPQRRPAGRGRLGVGDGCHRPLCPRPAAGGPGHGLLHRPMRPSRPEPHGQNSEGKLIPCK